MFVDLTVDPRASRDFNLRMRFLVCLLVCGLLACAGCGGKKASRGEAYAYSETPVTESGKPGDKVVVTPDNQLVGKVARLNSIGRFVVLNFQVGHLPQSGQTLNVYRNGLKVGEVKVTGPQYDDNVVADISQGEAGEGDQVRDR